MNLPPRGPQRPGLTRGAPQPPPRGRPTTSGSGRPSRPEPAKTNPLPIILGVIGILLVVLLFVVMSPGAPPPPPEKAAAPPPPPPAAPKPVDVSGLEREGRQACEDGLAIIKALEPRIAIATEKLSEDEQRTLKAELKKGIDLIKKGLAQFGEANERSGRTYDLNRFIQAMKFASNKYHGLKGE
jgi:hypothetical protein